MKTIKVKLLKDGATVTFELDEDELKYLLSYAVGELMEKGALSIIKDRNAEQLYRLQHEAPWGSG